MIRLGWSNTCFLRFFTRIDLDKHLRGFTSGLYLGREFTGKFFTVNSLDHIKYVQCLFDAITNLFGEMPKAEEGAPTEKFAAVWENITVFNEFDCSRWRIFSTDSLVFRLPTRATLTLLRKCEPKPNRTSCSVGVVEILLPWVDL